MAIAPVQHQLSKSMLTHIGIALTLGGGSAFTFWYKNVLVRREVREQYYIKDRAERAARS
ncbi:hypothetical protein CPB97_010937 [Podila verticillata]|nr:hypothetical protein BGZ59_009687 [Podila verticillata]KAF9322025.1 hypothetical protein BG003_008216 [Podila horticola]KAF9392703.1 hypothetical protein CPB97_010937 [Podila verticillata]KFH73620.1 hypothetical protein MVEG_00835 [Podila verticillata NRRL 6337]